ncbi:MAG: hypothetical protein WHV44_07620 [Anaerolineales bacterium]
MQRNVGVWIDHKQALVVQLNNGEKQIQVIESQLAPRTRLVRRSVGDIDLPNELHTNQRYEKHLKLYLDRVMEALQSADSILLMGPGEAKIELQKTLQKSKALAERIAAVETVGKLTQRQIAAKVSDFFTRQ